MTIIEERENFARGRRSKNNVWLIMILLVGAVSAKIK